MAAVLLITAITTSAAGGALEDGLAAFNHHRYGTAFRLLRPLADQGNASAQTDLGFMYNNGWGVPKNPAMAAVWFRKAAELGETEAQHQLGNLYLYGDGVRQDIGETLRWYRKAAEQGDDLVQDELGFMYWTGERVPQDYEEALMWFRRAAAQGNGSAEFSLGNMYQYGKGVPQDYVQAYMWYNLFAAKGGLGDGDYRDRVAAMMTPAQIAEAQRLSRKLDAEIIARSRMSNQRDR